MSVKDVTINDLPESILKDLQKNSESLTAENIFSQAAENFIPSAFQFGEDLVQPFLHPVQTAKDLYTLGSGIYQLFIPGEQPNEAVAKAVGQYFSDRYGSPENAANTFAKDPVGFLSDATIIFSGGGALISKTGKIAKSKELQKVGDVAQNLSQKFDPALLPLKTLRTTGEITKGIAGITTGVSGEPISIAYKSGKSGLSLDPQKRAAAQAFRKNLTEPEEATALVQDASDALRTMQQQKAQAYRTGMGGLASAENVIDFQKVKNIIQEVEDSFKQKGQLILSDEAVRKLKLIKDDVAKFEANPELHTVSGIDALKRMIDKRYNNKIDPDDVSALVAATRGRIRKLIGEEAPDYKQIMDDYARAELRQQEIQKSLSLGRRAAADTTIKKLQKAISEQPGVGTKQKSLQALDDITDTFLMERLSAQALSAGQPRGLGQITQPISFMAAQGADKPGLLGLLAAQTPRIVGELGYRGGQISPFVKAPFQAAPALRLFEATQQQEDPFTEFIKELQK
jgi:hypothetical protein